ncbi:hypothetical protein PVL29_004185 [Vitis rotundifolia]|uniref:Protein NRT1/ PTR FAMILY 1.2-like n=1 Tax=Vitis rotundifolia TaxID=103349 RepID=A0AA39DZ95_VITRO|nr:hypothetical protein PVL29_004185 [Vitis rotundifolia]
MPFIMVNQSFEKVAGFGIMPNMIFYLMNGYHMEAAAGSTILFTWSAFSKSLAVFGALLSDFYLGRFRVIAFGSFSSLLGITLLWLTAMIPWLKPPPCDQLNDNCNSATPAQLAVLFTSRGLISVGAGCIRPCSIAFGADQLDNKENPDNDNMIALTFIAYIQDHLGWKFGFGVPVILMVFSALMFVLGSSLYIRVKPGKNLLTGFVQVLVVAFKNRCLTLPTDSVGYYNHSSDPKFLAPTSELRCLNKACIIRDPNRDLNSHGSTSNPWSLCSVEQVESLKSPQSHSPMQTSFSTLQANTMDRHITPNFEIPAGTFSVFTIITLTTWLPVYDCLLVPILARYTGQLRGLSPKVRMGIGLVLSCMAMAVAAATEMIRRRIATKQGLEDQPAATVNMSALWLLPQYALLGLAEAFNGIGQNEFYYSQFPKSMSSLAGALFTLGLALSGLAGSLLVNVVNSVTTKGGKESWLSSNLNKGHLDYYYGLIAVLGMINFIYFLVCCRLYGPCEDEKTKLSGEVEDEQFLYSALPSS